MKDRSKTKPPKYSIVSGRRSLKFPLVERKRLAEVEFSTDTEDHSITLIFSDKTMLHFGIEPGFTVFPDYSDLKTGDVRPIRRWKPIHSKLFRE